MAKRFIGMDWDGTVLRIAVLSEERGRRRLATVARTGPVSEEEAGARLQELLGGTPGLSDHLAASLPAGAGFVRRSTFPFAERKKIAAALELELPAQLPAVTEEWAVAAGAPRRRPDQRYDVPAAAVPRAAVTDVLALFDDAVAPLEILDLAPFAYASGLAEECSDGLLACAEERETTLARVVGGEVLEHRLLPTPDGAEAAERATFLRREAMALAGGRPAAADRLLLIGSRAEPALVEELKKLGVEAAVPAVTVEAKPVAAEFLPAVALARRAAAADEAPSFNFRSGALALRNRWNALRKKLIAAAALFVASLLTLGLSAYLGYAHKARRVEALDAQTAHIYRAALPGSRVIAGVPPVMQMESILKDLRKKGRLIGAGSPSALAVLQQISALPPDLPLDVEKLSYESGQAKIEGTTTSFDAVNRIARRLEAAEAFTQAVIADAKMSVDGSRVSFRIELPFSRREVSDAQ